MNSSEDHQMNGGDSFIVDLKCFSNGLMNDPTITTTSAAISSNNNNTTTNPRITMQRSLSRKGTPRGVEKKINDRDLDVVTSSSPKGTQVVSMLEKPNTPAIQTVGSQGHSINNNNNNNNQILQQHQITIKTGGVSTISDGTWIKRSSFKRTPPSWFSDPKRVVLFFASLSSMGTILLIYFTLSMTRQNNEEGMLEW